MACRARLGCMQGFLASQNTSKEQQVQILKVIAGVGFKVSAIAHV